MIARPTLAAAALLLATNAHATTLKFIEHATTDTVSVHAGKAADNVGDLLTFTNDVFDTANKTKLGFDQGYCVRLAIGKAWECHWSLILPNGQITVDGPFLDTSDSTLAITGGTGAYAGAGGDMLLHARDAKGTAYDFTYRVK
jgi:allene oxide cyclase